jgi:hypothetical protein
MSLAFSDSTPLFSSLSAYVEIYMTCALRVFSTLSATVFPLLNPYYLQGIYGI